MTRGQQLDHRVQKFDGSAPISHPLSYNRHFNLAILVWNKFMKPSDLYFIFEGHVSSSNLISPTFSGASGGSSSSSISASVVSPTTAGVTAAHTSNASSTAGGIVAALVAIAVLIVVTMFVLV